MTLLKDLLEASKRGTTTKDDTKVDTGLDDLLNKPRSKGNLAKVTPKADEPHGGEEPSAKKHHTASAATTASKMKDVKIDNAPHINADEVDTSQEIDDHEALARSGHAQRHATAGQLPHHELKPTTQNLPAIISRALMAQEKGVARQHPSDIEWHMVKNLPRYLSKVIRAVGRQVFSPFTSTPIEDIQVVAHVGGGPNSMKEVDTISKFITQHGKREKDAELYFTRVIPDYDAQVAIYDALGFTFMFVKDFAGAYIYSWPSSDTKRDEFHSQIGRDQPRLGHHGHDRDLEELIHKHGLHDEPKQLTHHREPEPELSDEDLEREMAEIHKKYGDQ